jgi:GNAT superfamily N-acetyltransferase
MDGLSAIRLELTDAPDLDTRQEIARHMLAYNDDFLGGSQTRPLAVLVRVPDREGISGGLWGRTSHLWLFVEILFLPESLRGRGLGEQVVRLAEAEAAARGCIGAWLDTFSPAARRFYERQGYRAFGQIEDYPPGHVRFFMRKRFDKQSTSAGASLDRQLSRASRQHSNEAAPGGARSHESIART